jgi:phage shock protein C
VEEKRPNRIEDETIVTPGDEQAPATRPAEDEATAAGPVGEEAFTDRPTGDVTPIEGRTVFDDAVAGNSPTDETSMSPPASERISTPPPIGERATTRTRTDEPAEARPIGQETPSTRPIAYATPPEQIQPEARRLYRSRQERMLGGVAGGLAQYFNVDPALVRLAFVILTLSGGAGILAYIIMAIVVPERPTVESEPVITGTIDNNRGREVLALVLVGFGLLLLANNLGLFGFFRWQQFWPLVLIAIGIVLLFNRSRS